MPYARSSVDVFQLSSTIYANADVSFFTVDEDGQRTATLASLYADVTGSELLTNPQTLDSYGKFERPVYIEEPVIAVVAQNDEIEDELETGIISAYGRYRGVFALSILYYANDWAQDPITGGIYYATRTFTSTTNVAGHVTLGDIELALDATLFREWKGAWLTATTYYGGDTVSNGGSSYVCVTGHISGTFATDLAAGKWALISQRGDDGIVEEVVAGTGITVDNTDPSAPVVAFDTAQLSPYAPLASPALTGNPTVPTQTAGDSSTKAASTAFVTTGLATGLATKAALPTASSGPGQIVSINVTTGSTYTFPADGNWMLFGQTYNPSTGAVATNGALVSFGLYAGGSTITVTSGTATAFKGIAWRVS